MAGFRHTLLTLLGPPMRGILQGYLGALILHRRRQLGMTQTDLGRLIGTPASTVSELEQSPHRWQSPVLWRLAEALRLPQIELALAAGIITDLPTAQGASVLDLLRDESAEMLSTDEIAYLLICLDELPAAKGRLLLAIAEQLALMQNF